MEKTDLEVLNQMVNENNKGIQASTIMTDFKQVKEGGKITFGVSREIYEKLSKDVVFGTGKYLAIAYFIDKTEFDKIKNASK